MRARLQRGCIGAGAFLGQGEAADQIARGETRKISLLLLGGAVADQTFGANTRILRTDHPEGDRALGELDEGQRQLLLGQLAAAIVPGDAPAEGAEALHLGDEVLADAILPLDPVLVGDRDVAHEVAHARQQFVQACLIGNHGVRPRCGLTLRHLLEQPPFAVERRVDAASRAALPKALPDWW